MTMPTRVEFESETLTPLYGKFVVEPFERGYALTVGNALRRGLLSSIEGAAAVSVKFDGVQHEFSTIPGISEDVLDIVLSIRQLKVRLHGAPPKTIRMEVSGERKVTAADFEPNPEIEILNPDLHLATLTEKTAKLSFEVELDIGRGFVPAERNKRLDASIGVIPLDANFSPVTRVRYDIATTRVGQITDFECLHLEVWTDGRVTPEKAVDQAGFVLREHFALMVKEGPGEGGSQQMRETERVKELVQKGIEDLDLSVRAVNSLHTENIRTIGELVAKNDEDLLKFKNFGRKSLEEIKAALAGMGLSLGMDVSAFQPREEGGGEPA